LAHIIIALVTANYTGFHLMQCIARVCLQLCLSGCLQWVDLRLYSWTCLTQARFLHHWNTYMYTSKVD